MKKSFIAMLASLVLALCLAVPALGEQAMSDDWRDFTVELCGSVYALPLPVQTLVDDGWTIDLGDEVLEPNSYMLSTPMERDGARVYVQVINLGIDEMAASDCLVGQISVDSYQAEDGASITLAGGVTLGSTMEQITAAYGAAGDTYEGSSSTRLTYSLGSYREMTLSVDNETGALSSVEVQNFEAPEGYNDEALAAPVEVPESVTAYQAPEDLGDDLLSFNIKLNGQLYCLPAPFAAFEANGAMLTSAPEGKLSARASVFGVEMNMGGATLRTALYNDSPKANIAENCMVCKIEAREGEGVTLELPGGITIGTTHDELKDALEGLEYELYEGSGYTSYTLSSEDILKEIAILVDGETGLVYDISVEYLP